MTRSRPGALAAVLALTAPGAFAATLTFGDADLTCPTSGPSYAEAGLTIAALPESTLSVRTDPDPEAGGDNCILGYADPFFPGGGDVLAWEMTTSGRFSLESIVGAHLDPEDPVALTGYLAGAVVATQVLAEGLNDLSAFAGVDSVVMSMVVLGPGDPRLDELTYAPVPLPAAGAVLGAALAGLGLLRRRRRLQAPA